MMVIFKKEMLFHFQKTSVFGTILVRVKRSDKYVKRIVLLKNHHFLFLKDWYGAIQHLMPGPDLVFLVGLIRV